MLIGARAHFCAAHRLPQHDGTHGHSYEVWAYTDQPRDVEQFQRELTSACGELDHRTLNDLIEDPTMENIARYLVLQIEGLNKVMVTRPVEGLSCEWLRQRE